ncbi:DUF4142 domain-containing protein [Dyadobacter sandarakinus]|uniref:DUF4142 domain-containing protein n=1 Tax=Dyadobacter sandarakinus TaxID=2747268 RepID=A0ABX7I3Y3_9BACT|nr:DUF4142 domain-containing protein [Dyadobacter sandarakinus]QRR00277.1 DUF4142 domain-containing protein [Dyadobacter sandarakinus]
MKKVHLLLVAAMFFAVACDDDDDDDNGNMVSQVDQTFVTNAADGGMFEVKAGELAVSKGDTTKLGSMHGDTLSVKAYGRMMIMDHTKVNEELMSLATRKGAAVPKTLSAAKQQKIDSLSAANGAAFSRLYAKMMVASHMETIKVFQTETSGGNDTEIKTWAGSKVPALQHHLEMAEALQDSIQ